MKNLKWRLLLLMFLAVSYSCLGNSNLLHVQVDAESLDDSRIKLNGEWLFFWNELLTSKAIDHPDASFKSAIVSVPDYWQHYQIDGEPLPGTGYGTFGKQLIFDKSLIGQSMSLKIPVFNSSYNVFINDEMVCSSGVVGTTKEESEPGSQIKVIDFIAEDTVTLVIQIANFHQSRGGFSGNIFLGHSENISDGQFYYDILSASASILMLAFILILLYYFYLFPTRRGVFWLSLMILGVLIEDVGTSSSMSHPLLNFSWDTLLRLKLSGIVFLLVSASFCFDFYFPSQLMKRMNRWLIPISIIYCCLIWVLEPLLFDFSVYWLYLHAVIIFGIIFKAIGYQKTNSTVTPSLFAISMGVIFFGAANDTLVFEAHPIIFNEYILKYCFVIFSITVIQNVMEISASNFNSNVRLKEELAGLNEGLELQVVERTQELYQQKQEAILQNEIISGINKELEANLAFKHRIFSVIGHDLRGHSGSLMQIVEVLKDTTVHEEVKIKLRKNMFELPQQIFTIVDNLLYWGRSQNNELTVTSEYIDISERMNETIRLFSIFLENKKIKVSLNVEGSQLVYVDECHVNIILRNLFCNAIKFTNEGGSIVINVFKNHDEYLRIEVQDTGVGMDKKQVDSILSNNNSVESCRGTGQEKGTGIGLQLCRDLIALNNGEFGIRSKLNEGSVFWFTLPLYSN